MTKTVTLAAKRRETKGKGPARQMRLQGEVPAVVYGRGRDPQSLAVVRSDLEKLFAVHATGSTLIDLTIDDKPLKVLVRDLQRHPVQRVITHVDFYEIHYGVTITVDVPIHLDGVPEGVRNGGGTLDQTLREIQIAVLPRNIPERVQLEVTALEIGQSLHVRDLVIENAKLLTDENTTICTVIPPRIEAEVTPEVDEVEEEEGATEPELIRKPKTEEEGGESEG